MAVDGDGAVLDDVAAVGGILCDLEYIRSRVSNEDDLDPLDMV